MYSTGYTVKFLGKLPDGRTTTVMTLSNVGLAGYKPDDLLGSEIKVGDVAVELYNTFTSLNTFSNYLQAICSLKIFACTITFTYNEVASKVEAGNQLTNSEVFKTQYVDTFSMVPILRLIGTNSGVENKVTTNLRNAADPFETENYATKLAAYKQVLHTNELGAANNQDASIYFRVNSEVEVP